MIANTLQPGLLVSLKTSIRGNVAYQKFDIEADHLTEAGARRAKWETTRTVDDPKEHEKAVQIRGQCRSLITRVCTSGAFTLCPQSNEAKLESSIKEARELAEKFNETAKLSHIDIYVVVGRVASDDIETVQAVRSELRDLIADMEEGIRKLDSDKIRKAATEAKGIVKILSESAAKRVEDTITVARATAKQIVKQIVKASESAAAEVDEAALSYLKQSQSMFLDLEINGEAPSEPAVTGIPIELELPLQFRPKQNPSALASQIEL